MNICTKCQYNGKTDNHCLECECIEEYSYPHRNYLFEKSNIPAPDTSGSKQVTALDDEVEDTLRKFLTDLFNLTPLELLVFQSIMNRKSLTEFSELFNKMIEKQVSSKKGCMTRHHAFQIRKQILKKMPNIKQALLTFRQRKELKG